MKLLRLLYTSLLFLLLTGCFGPTSTSDSNITNTTPTIEAESFDNSIPATQLTDPLRAEPISVDIHEILTTHARIREILNGQLLDEQEISPELQQELSTLLDRSGPFETSMQLQHFKESLIGVLTSYKLIFYEDSLASLLSGSFVKSEQRTRHEAYLQDLGAVDRAQLEENDELIQRIATQSPIPYNDNQGVIIDQAILEVLIANQKKTNRRIDHIFDSYLSTTTIPPITPIMPDTSEAPVIKETPETQEAPDSVATNIPAVFTLGSTAEEVEATMGKPERMQNYRYTDDEWKYGESYVRFDADFKVNGFDNKGENLKILIRDIVPGALAIAKGSTRQQVAEVVGTPDAIFDYKSAGSSWSYGKSRVDFDKEGIVKGWINSADFDLFDN